MLIGALRPPQVFSVVLTEIDGGDTLLVRNTRHIANSEKQNKQNKRTLNFYNTASLLENHCNRKYMWDGILCDRYCENTGISVNTT